MQATFSNYSFLSTLKKYADSSFCLIFFTVLAVFCANVPIVKDWYFSLWQNSVHLSVGSFNFFSHSGHILSLGQVINDFIMAIFFLSVGIEIKREILVGELSSRDKAMLPVIGALGGMVVPTLIFWCICPDDPMMRRGLAIPMATDIAFSLGVLAMFKARVPIGLKVFLATLAVADDLGGILVIALFYTSDIDMTFIIMSILCAAVMIIANLHKCHNKNFYVVAGLVLWYFMLNSGLHATIAGVITAFCIPATLRNGTEYYLQRIRNNIEQFPVIDEKGKNAAIVFANNDIHRLKSIESAADKMISPLQALEDSLHGVVSFLVIPLFVFANAGIDLSQMSFNSLFSGVAPVIMVSLVAGKFLGVLSFSWIAVKMNIVRLPENTTWPAFAGVCMICGIGFTVSMFIADLSYSDGVVMSSGLLAEAKLGVLAGSIISALLGLVLLRRCLPQKSDKNARKSENMI